MGSTTVMWFRRDLRLADNAALAAAAAGPGEVVPVFVWPERDDRRLGAARCRWLHRSLAALDATLRERGSSLVVRCGPAERVLTQLAAECGACQVIAARDWTPEGRAEEDAVARALQAAGMPLAMRDDFHLVAPDALTTGSGTPFKVFTPYYRAWRARLTPVTPLAAPAALRSPALMPASSGPVTPPPGGPDLARWWAPGEAGAEACLSHFVGNGLSHYALDRDRPDLPATSRLSPHLAWGEISARRVFSACVEAGEVAEPFLRQLAWRDFAAHVLHHAPHTVAEPLRPEYSAMPWADDPAGLEAWKAGQTGYPLVDAGMRQLAHTGWMHNRVRLVAASLLTKHLLIDWRIGEAHFREALVDLDRASNVFNWQWVAGSGADAAPYFRIFNPAIQGARFDPDGAYVKGWVPELERLDARWVHRPAEAPPEALEAAGVALGTSYPRPIVDHAWARQRALDAFALVRAQARELRG